VATLDRDEFMIKAGLDPTRPLVALLPGSRRKEIERILPVMLQAATELSAKESGVQFVIPVLSAAARQWVGGYTSISPRSVMPAVIVGDTYNAIAAADAAAVTSGTATLETALLGTPMVIVYKTTAINYALLEPLISVDHYGLVNLIAGERLVTELIQGDLNPDRLTTEFRRLLDPETNVAMKQQLSAIADKLGHGGASKRAAEAILTLIS